jgi:predicted RND superfamily exporter protein
MWNILVRLILRNRLGILIGIGLITAAMAFMAFRVKLSYEMVKMLPQDDSLSMQYDNFKKRFGEDGNVLVIGTINPNIFKFNEFNAWYDLGNTIRKIDGIEEVVSLTRAVNLIKNDSLRQFQFSGVVKKRPGSQTEVDSLKKILLSLKFYEGFLYNSKTKACLMAITLDRKKLNDKSRIALVNQIKTTVEQYRTRQGLAMHYSGLPYIRTVTTQKVKNELYLFIILSIAIAAFILFLFFRSIKVVLSSLVVVAISIIWVLGTTAIFGYKITLLTGVIPSLIVIIAIENCIYILNKYHWEYRSHGNKVKALSRVVQRIGFASLMTNAATATGFAAFILVSNQLLREFGIITSINIMLEYILCITLLPIIFSYIDPPKPKHLKHLDNVFFGKILDKIIYTINHRRQLIYIIAGAFLLIGAIGVSLMKTSGKVVDDLRHDDPIYVDLKFFERNFGGVMPFEISIDTKKKNGVMRLETVEKIDELQKAIMTYPQFSRPLSIAELVKFAKQSYFNGNPDRYELPNNQEKNFILSYFPRKLEGRKNVMRSFIDSTKQFTRISFQMADVGTKDMKRLLADIHPQVDSIFNPADYNVQVTGNSVVYARGTEFLIRNLFESVAIAIVMISLLMALLFSSARMIVVSMVPNIIPLLTTAAIMGFAGIPIKPSTIIVFSIALGISVDNAIQYLSRYRHELKVQNGNIKVAAVNALREAGFSMIYTSIVLVLGFSVFIVSGFGGTQALGILISTTLFIAMFFNVMVLPSLLLSLDKHIVTKAFESEPIIEIYNENDDEGEDEKPLYSNHKIQK